MNSKTITATTDSKLPFAARLIAGIPLLSIGIQHATGMAPMEPILIGSGIPMPALNATVAPIFEILASLLLLSGFFARLGGLITLGAMSMATYAHIVFDWADEPPIALPIIIFICAAFIVVKGAGAFSVDLKKSHKS